MLLKDIREYSGIFLACGATDLRNAVDGLAYIVKNDFKMNPFGNYWSKQRKFKPGYLSEICLRSTSLCGIPRKCG